MSTRVRKLITVALAKQMMEAEAKQHLCRALDPTSVNQLAAIMSAGLWRETGAAITIDKNGNLLDGLTRIAAVVQSGVEVTMRVVTL